MPPEAEGYRWDTGPSLLLMPSKYREAFEALGEKFEDHVEIRRVEPTAVRCHYGDHTNMDLLYDMEKMREQLEQEEEGAGGKYFRFLGAARASYDLGLKAFIEQVMLEGLREWSVISDAGGTALTRRCRILPSLQDSKSILDFVDLRRVGPLALAVNPIDLLLSQERQLCNYFKSPKIRALFSYQELYVGLSPYNAPGVFSLLAATELTDGVWYPVGGFQKVRDALKGIAEKNGVKIRTQTEVARIVVDDEPVPGEDEQTRKIVKGVQLKNGEVIESDVVVANPDTPYVFDELLDFPEADKEAQRLEQGSYSCGMIEFNFALKGRLEGLTQHNVFLSSDYRGSWQRPWQPSDFAAPQQHNFYVHRPTYTDHTAAPDGCDSIMVLLPIANEQEMKKRAIKEGKPMPSEEDMIAAGREAVLRRFAEAGHGDLASMLQHEFIIGPSQWKKRLNLKQGSIFGMSHGLLQLACFRAPRQTGISFLDAPKVKGLHFVGASTRPGNGVPLVLMGVGVAFDNIMAEEKANAAAAVASADNGTAESS
eukprot:scaffold7806_cov376-Prasinococcus_capsulatus_cf.AAC.2